MNDEIEEWEEKIANKKLSRLAKGTNKKRKARNNSEESEQAKFISFLRKNYPEIIYHANPEGIRISIGQAVKLAKQGVINKSTPDIFIFKANSKYHGLIIELKKTNWQLYKKNGEIYKDEHVMEQRKFLYRFIDQDYFATFANGFEVAKEIFLAYIQEDFDKITKLHII